MIAPAVGASQALEPHTTAEINQQHRDQPISDLADAHDTAKEPLRDEGTRAGEAERLHQPEPVQARPAEPEPHPKLKVKPRTRR